MRIILTALISLLLFTVTFAQKVSTSSQYSARVEKATAQDKRFDGNWAFEQTRNGHYSSLSVNIKQVSNKLEGDYGNASSKESNGKILSSKITGNTATIEINCDWGGRGTVKITRLSGNRLHWQVIKRDERKGQFIVLVNQILKRQ